ncbi:MAG TPA: methylated-DNA--[protein]-cysteine S-methyltransferase [Candidatus Brocadiia bacterium]|nr:methylated-DNA--[protein]-cysteine S-methyltransferase [Candidatus Brocadiia bacterium]
MAEAKRPAADYRVFETAWGWCAAARTNLGYCALVLPMKSRAEAEAAIRARAPGAVSLPSGMGALVSAVTRYFAGERVEFEGDLDFTAGTPFQRRVWQAALKAGYGRVMTYAGVALEMGRPGADRAVAGALARNPLPLIVPCHRIVRSDGRLGGFSGPGGVAMKEAMLRLEGARLVMDGKTPRVTA